MGAAPQAAERHTICCGSVETVYQVFPQPKVSSKKRSPGLVWIAASHAQSWTCG